LIDIFVAQTNNQATMVIFIFFDSTFMLFVTWSEFS